MRSVNFHQHAWDQFVAWQTQNPKLAARLSRMISEIRREPFTGLGKPEPLKHNLKGCWSRRINEEHRLVYSVTEAAITVVSCNDHY